MEHPEQDQHLVHALLHEEGTFFAFIRKRVGTVEAAEDVLQAAYLKSLEKGHQVRSKENVKAWFFSLIRNALVDHFRNPSNARTSQMDTDWLENVASREDKELDDSAMGCVRVALRSLREDDASLITRVDIQGCPQEEVAAELGISLNALSVRLARARKALRGSLQDLCQDCRVTKCMYCRCGSMEGPC